MRIALFVLANSLPLFGGSTGRVQLGIPRLSPRRRWHRGDPTRRSRAVARTGVDGPRGAARPLSGAVDGMVATRGASRGASVASWPATPTLALRGTRWWRHGTRTRVSRCRPRTIQGESWTEPHRLSTDGPVASHPIVIHTGEDFVVFWTERGASGRRDWKSYRLGAHQLTTDEG